MLKMDCQACSILSHYLFHNWGTLSYFRGVFRSICNSNVVDGCLFVVVSFSFCKFIKSHKFFVAMRTKKCNSRLIWCFDYFMAIRALYPFSIGI